MNLCDNKYKAIFTDLFDTLVLRDVTAKTVVERWAVCIKKRYKCLDGISGSELVKYRQNAFKDCRNSALESSQITGKTEVDYKTAIGSMFDSLPQGVGLDKDEFINTSMHIDVAVECGCVYANKGYLKKLLAAKKAGKNIYCVTDYYLPQTELSKIISAADIPNNLFDGIFVSCDLGKRKATGEIYSYILNELQIAPSCVIMVGDSKGADYLNAQKAGLDAWFRPNYIYKCKIHMKDRLGIDNAKNQMKRLTNRMYQTGADYSEYIAIFYIFTKRLFLKLSEEGVSEIAFMAREGHYLRELFELYQNLMVNESERIKTTYFWCSRRSIMAGVEEEHTSDTFKEDITLLNWLKALQIDKDDIREFVSFEDSELEILQPLSKSRIYQELAANQHFQEWLKNLIQNNKQAFISYIAPFVKDGVFRFVDSGWKCTSQNAIEKYYGIKTKGYYIGVQIPDKPILALDRIGLIFSEKDPRSKYYDYLGMNIPFYQQLLAAPHGTALKYIQENGKIRILHEWDDMEKELYETQISGLQKYMLLKFMGLSAWDDNDPFDTKIDWLMAKLSMRSSLFAHGSRLSFVRTCTENYVQNFRQENRGEVRYDIKNVKIGPEVIWKPEKLIRYVSKIQRTTLYNKKVVRALYPVVSRCFYAYVILFKMIKR